MVAILKKIKWLTNVLETIYPDVSLCQFWWLHYTIYVVITNLLEISVFFKMAAILKIKLIGSNFFL